MLGAHLLSAVIQYTPVESLRRETQRSFRMLVSRIGSKRMWCYTHVSLRGSRRFR